MDRLHALFEEMARTHPEQIAITDRGRNVTYRELNELANRIGWRLAAAGVEQGMLVGICCERSAELIASILGALKAGAAYVPIDPEYPAARIRYIQEDSACRHVVGHARLRGRISGDVTFIACDEPGEQSPAHNLPPSRADAAYVIYTSGSTGNPKGVVVTHRNAVRLFDVTREGFGFGNGDVWTLFHSASFDFSVWEIWGALIHGGRLVITPFEVSRSPGDFLALLIRERVTVLNQTPSAFQQLIAAARDAQFPETSLRLVIFGGEALRPPMLPPWTDHYGFSRPLLVNMYGITETTVHVTAHRLTPGDLKEAASPIGAPLADLTVRLLDQEMRPVRDGEPGEIYVGGPGVAAGYLNQPGLTRQRFIPDPFCPGGRLYRSGDLAARRPDGVLVFHGRSDDQVKLRGFRIEPREIEAAALRLAPVKDAAVLLRDDHLGRPVLACYLVREDGRTLTAGDMHALLAAELPAHMVPAVFAFLDRLPLTSHGKLDRAALPEPVPVPTPGAEAADGQAGPQRPGVGLEQRISRLWAEYLGWDTVRPADNFFELGGDSMLAVQLVSEMRAAGLATRVEDVYQHPTIEGLLRFGRSGGQQAGQDGLPGTAERFPLSQNQLSIIFDASLRSDPTLYHDLTSVWVAGEIDRAVLLLALGVVAARHASLRTSFDLAAQGGPVQVVSPHAEIPLSVTDSPGPAADPWYSLRRWWTGEWQHSWDLGRAPLVRCHVLRHADGTCHLSLTAHHSVIDGWSFAQLMSELVEVYGRLERGEPATGECVAPDGYRRFIAAERAMAASEPARAFWGGYLSGAQPPPLPAAGPPAAFPRTDPDFLLVLGREVMDQARVMAATLGVPLKSVLLAAYLHTLSAAFGTTDVTTGISMNARLEEAGSEAAVGLFVNALPLRVELADASAPTLVKRVYQAEQGLLQYRAFPLPEIISLSQGRRPFSTTFNFVDFHPLRRLQAGRDLAVRGRWTSDRASIPVAADVVHDVFTGRWELCIRIDDAETSPALADKLGGIFHQSLHWLVSQD